MKSLLPSIKSVVLALGLCVFSLALCLTLNRIYHWSGGVSFNDSSREITIEQILELEFKPLWVDARKTKDYEDWHIPGALRLHPEEWGDFSSLDQAWDRERSIVVYCNVGCQYSRLTAARLRKELATSRVFELKGGYPEWQRVQ